MQPTLLVLAAGMGSRFGGLKQVEPLGPSGETLLDYSVYDALRAGFDRVVFVIRRDIEADFREKVGRKHEARTDVAYAFQQLDDLPGGFTPPEGRTKPWGTTQAIWAARDIIQSPFATINADDFYGAPAYQSMATYLSSSDRQPNDAAMAGYRLDRTLSDHGAVSRGLCQVSADGWLQSVVEHTKIARDASGIIRSEHADEPLVGDEQASMNFWGLQPNVFPYLEKLLIDFLKDQHTEEKSEHFIPTAVASMIEAEQVRVKLLETDSPWFGVTFREDRDRVAAALAELTAKGDYPTPLQSS